MSAVISPCGKYRYRLDREVQAQGVVFAYFGVNPSTADADAEDATTKKWRGFTARNGGRKYIAGNPFAARSTDVRKLAEITDPVGPENMDHLRQIIKEADILVPCWGLRTKLPHGVRYMLDRVAEMLFDSGKPVRIFGLTKSGDPIHPLMLGYDTPLIPWGGKCGDDVTFGGEPL